MTDQHADAAATGRATWGIDSNRGWSHFECARVADVPRTGHISCRVQLWGEFWDRNVPTAAADLVPDFRIDLPQVLMAEESLRALHDHFDHWLTSYEHFDCELVPDDAGGQSLVVSVGKREDMIYTRDKPAITFTYSAGFSMRGEWSFVIDQSCVWLCRDALKEFLHR